MNSPDKTDLFKKHLQSIIKNRLGERYSKKDSWELFKSIIHGTVEFVSELEDNRLPLAGVGIFEILKTKPRGRKKEEGWEFVPRYKFYPSVKINNYLEQIFEFDNHNLDDYGGYGLFNEDIQEEEIEEEDKQEEEIQEEIVEEEDIEEDKQEEDIMFDF